MNGADRITTAEAARRLGVAPATVRRWIVAGDLPAQCEPRPGGSRWWVLWSEDLTARTVRAHEPVHERAPERTGDRDALAVALRTITRLERELEIAHSEKAQLLSALNARALPSPEPVHDRAHERDHERAHERAPWWQFWRRRA
jgi:excisionase family DNA binding protein